MSGSTLKTNVVVIGAGTSGSAAAWMLAEVGFRVVLVERRSRKQAGGNWVNDVADWMFLRAGIPDPAGKERVGGHLPFTFLPTQGGGRVRLRRRPSLCVDMRLLVNRLQDAALDSGVELLDRTVLQDLEMSGDRPRAVIVEKEPRGKEARKIRIEADLFVDASGLAGALRKRFPNAERNWPRVSDHDLCAASQATFEVIDRAGATTFLERYGVPEGGNLAWAGIRGGFSTRMVTLHPDSDRVELLTGAIASRGYNSGEEIILSFLADEKWIGKRIFGGSGLIPLRRPYSRLVAPGFALLGDACCQVFPLHGSGVGNGLIAARMLAEAVKGQTDPGATRTLWSYQVAFQREIGAVNAANDVLRCFSQKLDSGQVDELTNRGLIGSRSIEAGLGQRFYLPDIPDLARMLEGAFRTPLLAARFTSRVPAMLAAWTLYRVHPVQVDGREFQAWTAAESVLLGGQGTH